MEWLGLGLVGAVAFFWWLGREPAQAPGPDRQPSGDAAPGGSTSHVVPAAVAGVTGLLAAEVLRRATDMNDPDGTFMDGYVAGRLTERAESRDELEAAREAQDDLDTSYRWSYGDEEGSDEMDGSLDEDMSDDW